MENIVDGVDKIIVQNNLKCKNLFLFSMCLNESLGWNLGPMDYETGTAY